MCSIVSVLGVNLYEVFIVVKAIEAESKNVVARDWAEEERKICFSMIIEFQLRIGKKF